uniref:MHC class I-like antigen recognition-like domain-containing protein n=1 Tax=Astyanax mexicanus TaxID=7994 RepID=A0A8B9H7M4_ASTMX
MCFVAPNIRSTEEKTLNIFVLLETHSLQYISTAMTPGTNFPEYTLVGLIDLEPVVYYDSNIRKMIPLVEWMEEKNDKHYWDSETEKQTELLCVSAGIHMLQRRSGCEWDDYEDDRTKRGYFQFGYDGEDFLSLDLKTETWTAASSKALITKTKWDANVRATKYRKNYLENDCILWLQRYLGYRKSFLQKRAQQQQRDL